MKLYKPVRLSSNGFGHHIVLPIVVIALIALVGVKVMIPSHAAPLPSASSSSKKEPPGPNAYPGYTQALLDNFTGTSLNQTTWNGFYQNINEQYGPFLASHGSVANGIVTMSNYVDPAADGASSGTNRAGTGMETRASWTSGMAFVRAKCSGGVGVGMVIGMIGTKVWPPELDFYEDGLSKTNARHTFTASAHYSANNSAVSSTNNNVNATQWHTYGVIWNSSTIQYLVDGKVWYSVADPDPTGSNGFSEPMALFMQIGTLGWGANNVPVSSSTPAKVNMKVDWATVYVPST